MEPNCYQQSQFCRQNNGFVSHDNARGATLVHSSFFKAKQPVVKLFIYLLFIFFKIFADEYSSGRPKLTQASRRSQGISGKSAWAFFIPALQAYG